MFVVTLPYAVILLLHLVGVKEYEMERYCTYIYTLYIQYVLYIYSTYPLICRCYSRNTVVYTIIQRMMFQFWFVISTELIVFVEAKTTVSRMIMIPYTVSLDLKTGANLSLMFYLLQSDIILSALKAIRSASRNDDNKVKFGACGGCEAVVSALKTHSSNEEVVKDGCWVIKNLLMNNDNRNKLQNLGINELLRSLVPVDTSVV